ncbi:hypothetical protein ACIB24_08505 [Spongisporangium articulatum]|uniref:Uncharacterized protein n=1 Tax=Spongisporangium articulatum TaxID=3362603 RepID=A0ABW8AL58_9ACTN
MTTLDAEARSLQAGTTELESLLDATVDPTVEVSASVQELLADPRVHALLAPVGAAVLTLAVRVDRSPDQEQVHRLWAAPDWTLVLGPDDGEQSTLAELPTDRVPALLSRIVGLGPRKVEWRESARLPVDFVEALLGDDQVARSRALAELGCDRLWQVQVATGPAAPTGGQWTMTVLDGAQGLYELATDVEAPALAPTTSTAVFRAFAELLSTSVVRKG